MPQKVKDEMLYEWSRESCIAAVEQESAKTASITASRAGTGSGARNHLTVNGVFSGNNDSDVESPTTAHPDGLRGESPSYGLVGGLATLHKLRRTSTNGSPKPATLSSSRESMIRVTDLKRALSGYGSDNRHASSLRRPVSRSQSQDSEDSNSMVSYHDAEGVNGSNLDLGAIEGNVQDVSPSSLPDETQKPQSSLTSNYSTVTTTSITIHDFVSLPRDNLDPRLGSDVPPVPRIPSSLNLPGTYPRDPSPVRPMTPKGEPYRPQTAPQGLQKSKPNGFPSSASVREGRSLKRGYSRPVSRRDQVTTDLTHGPKTSGKVDVGKLLAGIQSGTDDQITEEKENTGMNIKPPY